MKRFRLTVLFLALAVVAAPGFTAAAQKSSDQAATEKHEKPVPVVYSVHYVICELANGKRINSRSYTLMAAGSRSDRGSVRVTSSVPFAMGSYSPRNGSGAPESTQLQYKNVGMSIDCDIPDVSAPARQVMVNTNINWSFMPGSDKATHQPIFSNLQFSGPSLVPLGKPTVIGKMDDTTSDHQYQIEVTVKKVE